MIMSQNPLVDGHNDLPWQLWGLHRNNLSAINLESNLTGTTQSDIPRLRAGTPAFEAGSLRMGSFSPPIPRFLVWHRSQLSACSTSSRLF